MKKLTTDEKFMKRCLELAKKAGNKTSPNPLVGCVIVKDNKVISEGYHKRYGDLHAERIALEKIGYKAEGATLYVNLEPCSHWGKTPPCTDAIIESGIKRVVIGMLDPNPVINGNGVKILRENGIDVTCGVLEKECKWLNRGFVKWIKTGKPYIIIKWAQTLDGKIATVKGISKWLSSEKSLKYAHKLRAFCDAVIVGKNTLINDNPELTVRLVKGKNPKRVILMNKIHLEEKLNVVQKNPENTWIFGTRIDKDEKEKLIRLGIRYNIINERDGSLDLEEVFKILGNEGYTKVLVEGGGKIIGELIRRDLFDEINVIITPKIMGKGKNSVDTFISENITGIKCYNFAKVSRIGNDILIIILNPTISSYLS